MITFSTRIGPFAIHVEGPPMWRRAAWPEADFGQGGGPGHPLALVPGGDAAEPVAAPPAFYHGDVSVHPADEGDWWVVDPFLQVRVPRQGGVMHWWAHGPAPAPAETFEVTLLVALALALRREGWFHLHAASLRSPEGVEVLLAGVSGSGKSTAALDLIHAGWSWRSDDVAFLRRAPGDANDVEVIGWPRPVHATPFTLARHPGLTRLRTGELSLLGKERVDLARVRAPVHAAGVVDAVLLPRREPGRAQTELLRCTPGTTFAELVVHAPWVTLPFLDGHQEHRETLAALVRAPVHSLVIGADAHERVDALSTCLSSISPLPR